MARPTNTGSRAVRVAKPGMVAADNVSAFSAPTAYGPGITYRNAGWKQPQQQSRAATRPQPQYGSRGTANANTGQYKLSAYNAYGQPYGGAPTQHSAMPGTRPSYVDPATGETRQRFVGRDPAFSNAAVARYTFMGQAPGSAMSFIGGF